MSGLTIGGNIVPIAANGSSRPRLDAVDRARALDNSYKASVIGNPKRDFHFVTPPVTRANADMYEYFLSVPYPVNCAGDVIGGSSNLLTYSEQFDNAIWAKTAATVTADSNTAPNGTLTADHLVETIANSQHAATQTYTGPQQAYTFSVWVCQAERSKCVISLADGTGGFSATGVDLTNGTTFASGFAVGSWTGRSSTVTAYANGWYRVTVTGTSGAGTVAIGEVFIWTTTSSYIGTAGSGILVWGAQLEAAAAATSYIQTTSAALNTLTVSCVPEIVSWDPVVTAQGHSVVIGFVLHEV